MKCAWMVTLLLSGTAIAAERPEFPEASHRLAQPAPGTAATLQLPKVETFTLPGGPEVLLVTRRALPTVQMSLEVPGGTRLDGPGEAGRTSLCMALGSEATKTRDRLALKEAQADLAAKVGAWSSDARLGVSLSVLKAQFPAALALWADLVLHPAMGQADLDRLRARRKASLTQQKGSAGGLSGRLQPLVVWGRTHPHGQLVQEAALDAVTPEICAEMWTQRLKPGGATLYVVGDLSKAELLAAWTPLMADWKGQVPAQEPLPAAQTATRQLFLADVPGSPQSALTVTHVGPARQDPQFASQGLLSAILGGGFSSRINMNLREVHGWAYGARGVFDHTEIRGTWLASASVRADATGPALGEILAEMAKIRTEDVTPTEIDRERDGTIASLPARWITSDAILSGLRRMRTFGLPLDDDATLPERLRKATAASIRDAAQTWLHPEDAAILVVGDLTSVRPQLTALAAPGGPLAGWKVTVLDADGNEKL